VASLIAGAASVRLKTSPPLETELRLENRADVATLAMMYSENATNHQVAEDPVVGRAAIRDMFANEFARAKMVCIVENIFQDGEWAILEWRDPLGLRERLFPCRQRPD
jgi:hypothetical protein